MWGDVEVGVAVCFEFLSDGEVCLGCFVAGGTGLYLVDVFDCCDEECLVIFSAEG